MQRVEETITFDDPQGGACLAPVQSQTRCRQRLHRTAERKAVRMAALTEQEQERQLRLVIEQEELFKCLNSRMVILTPDQVRRVVNAVTGTNKGPMEAIGA